MSVFGYVQYLLYRVVVRIAWTVADFLGWRAAMPVYPAVMRGKVAIVTGANSGIGFETTKALLQVKLLLSCIAITPNAAAFTNLAAQIIERQCCTRRKQ